MTLTEEQQEFLKSLEEKFKDRFTEKDKEFMAYMKIELPEPPVYENWIPSHHDNRQWNPYSVRRGDESNNYYNYQRGQSNSSSCSYHQRHYSYYRAPF